MPKRSLESFVTELESIKEDLIVKINDAFNTIEDCLNEQINE